MRPSMEFTWGHQAACIRTGIRMLARVACLRRDELVRSSAGVGAALHSGRTDATAGQAAGRTERRRYRGSLPTRDVLIPPWQRISTRASASSLAILRSAGERRPVPTSPLSCPCSDVVPR